jgi:hypothetical protein
LRRFLRANRLQARAMGFVYECSCTTCGRPSSPSRGAIRNKPSSLAAANFFCLSGRSARQKPIENDGRPPIVANSVAFSQQNRTQPAKEVGWTRGAAGRNPPALPYPVSDQLLECEHPAFFRLRRARADGGRSDSLSLKAAYRGQATP